MDREEQENMVRDGNGSARLVVVLLAVGIGLAGCSGSSDSTAGDSPRAGASGTSSMGAPAGGGGRETAAADDMAKYARCLRDQKVKVKVEEDIVIAAPGQNTALVNAARKACAEFGPEIPLTDADKAYTLKKDLETARCLRKQGLKVNDPRITADGDLVASIPDPRQPQNQAAFKVCNYQVAVATGGPAGS